MADDTQLILDLSLGVDKLNSQLVTIQNQLGKTGEDAGEKFGKGFESGISGIGKVISAVVGAAAAVAGAFSLQKAIHEASQAEEAVNSLNIALASSGKYSESASESIQLFAEELQKTTRFSDDAVIASAALIENLAKLDTEGLKKATTAATDLSAALKIDLQSASELVARAANGNVMALSKLGFEFTKNATDAEKFAQALSQIEQRFGGQAQASVNTYAGAMTQLGNKFSDLFETFGKIIITNPVVITLIKQLGLVFDNLKVLIIQNSGAISIFISDLIKLGVVITSGLITPLEKTGLLIKAIIMGGASAFGYLTAGVFKLVEEFTNVIIKITELSLKVLEFANPELAKKLRESLLDPIKGARDEFKSFADESFDNATTIAKSAKDAFVGLFDETNGESPLAKLLAPLSPEAIAAVLAELEKLKTGVSNTTNQIQNDTDKTVEAFNNLIRNGIAKGIGAATQAMTTAMMKGDNVLKAFAGSILATLGDLSIQMGQFLILAGLGLQALTSNPITAGFATVAAGIALVALGTILKSFSQKPLVGGGDYSGSANAGIYNPNETLGGSPLGQKDDQKKGTEVTVNVQGNVFNQRETGLEIARIIRDSFEQEGVTTVGAV